MSRSALSSPYPIDVDSLLSPAGESSPWLWPSGEPLSPLLLPDGSQNPPYSLFQPSEQLLSPSSSLLSPAADDDSSSLSTRHPAPLPLSALLH